MENKQDNTLAWVSYITIVGWIIALVMYNDSQKGNTLVRFHLRQSLGLILTAFAGGIALVIIAMIPILGLITVVLLPVLYIGIFVLLILGIINAVQSEEKPIPLFGKFYDEKLTFIN